MKISTKKKAISLLLVFAMLLSISNVYAFTIDSLDYYDKIENAAFDIRGKINGGETLSTTYDDYGYQVLFRVTGENEEIDTSYDEYKALDDFFANDPNCPPYPAYPSNLPDREEFDTYSEFFEYLEENGLTDTYSDYVTAYQSWMEYVEYHYDEYIEYVENNQSHNQTGSVNTQEVYLYKMENGGSIENNGVTLKLVGSKPNNNSVKVDYIITNGSNSTKNYALSTASDIEFGDNDLAAVAKENHEALLITQDDEGYESTYRGQMKINFSPDVDTAWIGNYEYNIANRYKESNEIYYTLRDDEDTGLAYSWSGTLAAGETKTLTAAFKLQEAVSAQVNFFKDGNETSTPDSSISGLVGGGITLPETKECNEEGYTYIWATKKDGTGEFYGSGVGAIINAPVINLYEIKIKENATIHFETNGGNAMEDITQKVGTKLSIATPTKSGAKFEGWYLDNNTFKNKANYLTMPSGDVTLYAKWSDSSTTQEKTGTIEKDTNENQNFGSAHIETDISELKEIALTEEDIKLLDEGENINLYLEVKDVSDTISEEEKALIEKAKDGSEIGIFLDINLFKKIGNNEPEKITKTNGKIKISFEIPEKLLNKDSSVNRKFYILKLHDGVVTKLEVTVDGTTATFETDEFSAYALSYTDTAVSNPKTGDNIVLWIGIALISFVGILGTKKISIEEKRTNR